ncbi:Nn.00g034350.m01.CDS01 [Neocucurbitaria sp. VM-36]
MSLVVTHAPQLKPELRLAQAISEFEEELSGVQKDGYHVLRSRYLASAPDVKDVMALTALIDQALSGNTGGRCFGPRYTKFLESVQQFAAVEDNILGLSQNLIARSVWSLVYMSLLSIKDYASYVERLSLFFMEVGRSAPRVQEIAHIYRCSRDLRSYLSEYFIIVVRLCHRVFSSSQRSDLQRSAPITSILNDDSYLKSLQQSLEHWSNLIREETTPKSRQRKEGYLVKRGKNFGGWKTRFYVLDGPEFRYYESEGGTLLGTIKLHGAQIGKQSQDYQSQRRDEPKDNQYRHAFLIVELKENHSNTLVRHVLCAENDEERDAWVDALLQHIDYPNEVGKNLATKSGLLDFCSTYDHQATWKQTRKIGNASIFAHSADYKDWRDSSNSCTLLLLGKSGSGKSVLLANIVDDLTFYAQKDEVPVAYFFCRRDIPESLKARTILGSLVRQLFRLVPPLPVLAEAYEETNPAGNTEELLGMLLRGFPPTQKAFLVIDGLYDCDLQEWSTVVREVQALQDKLKLLLCASFRFEQDISLSMFIVNRVRFFRMPDKNPDIETFIGEELYRCLSDERLVLGDGALSLEIQGTLSQLSQGRFLWTAVQIKSLCGLNSDPEIYRALEAMRASALEVSIVKQSASDDQTLYQDYLSESSADLSLPGWSVTDDSSKVLGACSSTQPSSFGTSKPNTEGKTTEIVDLDSQDSETVYSVDSVLEDPTHALLFAHRLRQDLKTEFGLESTVEIPAEFINDAIGAFAWKLYEESTNPFQWETSVVLRRKKNEITNIMTDSELNEIASSVDEGSDDEDPRPAFVKPDNYLSDWAASVSGMFNGGDQQLPRSEEAHSFELPDHEAFIHQSDAYRWLLSNIHQRGLIPSKEAKIMTDIGKQVLDRFQAHKALHTMSRRRPSPMANMTFQIDWSPKAYITSLGLNPSSADVLNQVLCLTGTWCEAQAMTVSEYISQTWPTSAELITTILQKLITMPILSEYTYVLPGRKGACIRAFSESETSCKISVIAGIYFISELAEQIAWLAATLRSSPHDHDVVICHPHIKDLDIYDTAHLRLATTFSGTCSISFIYGQDLLDRRYEKGFCWAPLFRHAVLVSGYPILRRPEPGTGLELSLSTLAFLIQSDQVVQCGHVFILKGFSSLVSATFAMDGIMLWHYFASETPGKRISYFDGRLTGIDMRESIIPPLQMLESSRHIVGWCAKATDFCGHVTANCSITASGLRPSPSSTVIDRMYIEGGMHAIGGISFRPNCKEQPIKLHRERDYPEILQMVASHPIAFSDVSDRRTWLVDGASALLYLVRISLHLDATDPGSAYDWVFDESLLKDTWGGGCDGRSAALKTLKSWEHRSLPVYVKGQSIRDDGQVVRQFSTFGDRIDKILHWLEILIDRDVYLASQDGIKLSQTLDRRRNLSGFDLLDIVKPLGPIGTRTAQMKSSGDGWTGLFSSIGVTTIFGNGFGDLIRPNDLDRVCTNWKSVPVGMDYLITSTSTLRMIQEKRLMRLTPSLGTGELTSKIHWVSLYHPFDPCYCIEDEVVGKREHLNPVQFLVSKKPWTFLRKSKDTVPIDISTLHKSGAVVFTNDDPLYYKVEGSGSSHTVDQGSDEASSNVTSSEGQSSVFSATSNNVASSATSTDITRSSEGSVQNSSESQERRIKKQRFPWRWNSIRKK